MLGSLQFEIKGEDFIKGMSTAPNINDGGFSNETLAVNPIASVGVIYGPPSIFDRSTNTINGNVIMSHGDATFTGAQKFLGTDTGYFYSIDSTYAPTVRQSAVAGTYTQGYADMVQFAYGGNAYTFVSNSTDIVRMTGSTLSALDATWWTTTLGMTALGINPIGGATGVSAPHPMIVFENALWIADFNRLHKWDGTTASYSFLTLPQDQTIIALGIDPSTGKMLISTTQGANASDTVAKVCKILIYDGFSPLVSRSVIVDDMVTAIYPMGGTVFMPYGLNLGYWNGSGITFLRRLKNTTYDALSLIYKHKITSVNKTLYLTDGVQILAYGEILPGQKRFYYANKATIGSPTVITAIMNLGVISGGTIMQDVGLCYNDGTNKILASFGPYYTTITKNTLYFYTHKYEFKRRIQVKEILVEYADSIAASGSGGVLTMINQGGEDTVTLSLTNDSSAAVYELTANPSMEIPVSTFVQLKYENVSAKGLRRIIVSYDYMD